MLFNDILWERKLKIDTEGRDESCADEHHQPYQPTYYAVLEHLADTGMISPDSVLVDYGCGKGRVLYFMYHSFGCRCIGIEREDKFYNAALKNMTTFIDKRKVGDYISFVQTEAEKYEVPAEADTFFFFNPFSVNILMGTMQRIMDSYYANPRRLRFIFYYLLPETESYLSGINELQLVYEADMHKEVVSRDRKHILRIYTI